jgi:CRISPR-associated protein (TIGR02584 family)
MKRNVFIVTLGETPAVVTETVYALLSRDTPWVPTEIHIVTHTNGRNRSHGALAGPGSELAAVFAAKKKTFPDPVIHVPHNLQGSEIADIVTEADNVAFANTLTKLIKRFADDENTTIHLSLSGGRKTMSAYAALAISLFGREQDELSHVFVAPQEIQERANNFYWPDQETQVLVDRQGGALTDTLGRPITAKCALVVLANTPFLRLHGLLKEVPFPNEEIDYASVVDLVQTNVGVRSIALFCRDRRLVVGPYSLKLGQAEFALYRLVATAAQQLWKGAGPDGHGIDHCGWLTYQQIFDRDGNALKLFLSYLEDAYAQGVDRFESTKEFILAQIKDSETATSATKRRDAKAAVTARFSQLKARINKRLRDEIPSPTLRRFSTIEFEDDGGPSRFGITVPPDQIFVHD